MVHILRKAALPEVSNVTEHLRSIAAQALSMALREPRPVGFPLLFTADLKLIEPAVAFLHEHAVRRAHTGDTVRSYAEILYDWFETLEQNGIDWSKADAIDLLGYRNRMMQEPSAHTGRPYSTATVNHRVRGVLRFYEWAVHTNWLEASQLAAKSSNFSTVAQRRPRRFKATQCADDSFFVLRQFDSLPRPLVSEQARELLVRLAPPYDLMAKWQLYTGLGVSELLRLDVEATSRRKASLISYHPIDVIRKGRKPGYVIASASLLEETDSYVAIHRHAWLKRARGKGRLGEHAALFINARGAPAGKNAYQRAIGKAGRACGFKATTHLLRATFACMLLARLERLASEGAAINPLLIVKTLMGHRRIETTDRYLRAIVVDATTLKGALEKLLSEEA
jgi:integrase